MSTPYHKKERRFALRIPLRLPILVSDGEDIANTAWSEPTATDDISTKGALFSLNQEVHTGDRLQIRAKCQDGAPVVVAASVIRIALAVNGPTRVGVQIVDPTEDWLRLFASWIGDR